MEMREQMRIDDLFEKEIIRRNRNIILGGPSDLIWRAEVARPGSTAGVAGERGARVVWSPRKSTRGIRLLSPPARRQDTSPQRAGEPEAASGAAAQAAAAAPTPAAEAAAEAAATTAPRPKEAPLHPPAEAASAQARQRETGQHHPIWAESGSGEEAGPRPEQHRSDSSAGEVEGCPPQQPARPKPGKSIIVLPAAGSPGHRRLERRRSSVRVVLPGEEREMETLLASCASAPPASAERGLSPITGSEMGSAGSAGGVGLGLDGTDDPAPSSQPTAAAEEPGRPAQSRSAAEADGGATLPPSSPRSLEESASERLPAPPSGGISGTEAPPLQRVSAQFRGESPPLLVNPSGPSISSDWSADGGGAVSVASAGGSVGAGSRPPSPPASGPAQFAHVPEGWAWPGPTRPLPESLFRPISVGAGSEASGRGGSATTPAERAQRTRATAPQGFGRHPPAAAGAPAVGGGTEAATQRAAAGGEVSRGATPSTPSSLRAVAAARPMRDRAASARGVSGVPRGLSPSGLTSAGSAGFGLSPAGTPQVAGPDRVWAAPRAAPGWWVTRRAKERELIVEQLQQLSEQMLGSDGALPSAFITGSSGGWAKRQHQAAGPWPASAGPLPATSSGGKWRPGAHAQALLLSSPGSRPLSAASPRQPLSLSLLERGAAPSEIFSLEKLVGVGKGPALRRPLSPLRSAAAW